MILLLAAAGSIASVPAQARRQMGIVVSIRGSIIEVQPSYLRAHERVVIDKDTQFVQESDISPNDIPIGTKVLAWGHGDAKKGVNVEWLTAGILDDFAVNANQPGIHEGFGGLNFSGTLRSHKPFVVRDSAGTDIKAAGISTSHANYVRAGSPKDIMIGWKIRYSSDVEQGGVYHLTQLSVISTPGKSGVLFATVVKPGAKQMTVLPRFGRDTIDVAVSPKVKIERQLTLDPDSVKVGQTITAWGSPTPETKDIIAFALMPGVGRFPAASGNPAGEDVTISGKVVSLSPFILRQSNGKNMPVNITGQTPLMAVGHAGLADVKPGTRVMLLLSRAKSGGGFVTNYILIDASPILAFGM